MANLLTDPNNWKSWKTAGGENQYVGPPSEYWDQENSSFYYYAEIYGRAQVSMLLVPDAEDGDVLEGEFEALTTSIVTELPPTLTAYDADGLEMWHIDGVIGERVPFSGMAVTGMQLATAVPDPEQFLYAGESRIYVQQGPEPPVPDEYNCDCDSPYERKTLLQMYERVMRRAGYAAQLSRPPPGTKELVIDFINEAERLTMADFEEIGQRRFFRWQLQEGVRRYGVDENIDVCARVFNQLRPKGVYLVRNGEWCRLRRGINPEWYSGGVHNTNPTHYEIRQCIEVFPAPSADSGLLVIEGAFKVGEMVADGDYTSADPEAVFLRALAMYKAHKQHPDAQVAMGQYDRYIGNVNADEHSDRRYVPPERMTERGDCDRLVRRMSPGIYGDEP